MELELTEAERRYDALVTARRRTGRSTYGRGLTHSDPYDWRMMALEEALDMGQYLMAELVRREAEVVRLEQAIHKVEVAVRLAKEAR